MDKYDLFIQRIDHFQSLVDEKKQLQDKIAGIEQEYAERIRPLQLELDTIIKKLDQNLAKLETTPATPATSSGYTKYGRGQLGEAIKDLLRSNPDKAFKPKQIATALNTKSTSISLWFNKYGTPENDIERIPAGAGGKRFVYKIKA